MRWSRRESVPTASDRDSQCQVPPAIAPRVTRYTISRSRRQPDPAFRLTSFVTGQPTVVVDELGLNDFGQRGRFNMPCCDMGT